MTARLASGEHLYRALERGDRLSQSSTGRNWAASVQCVLTFAEVGFGSRGVTHGAGCIWRDRRCSRITRFSFRRWDCRHQHDAERAVEAGARFIVTPAVTPGAETTHQTTVEATTGALPPTDVVAALVHASVAVKVFPADALASTYIKATRDPLPDAPLAPVGRVDSDNARAYLNTGAVALGAAAALLGDAARPGSDPTGLQRRPKRLQMAVAAA